MTDAIETSDEAILDLLAQADSLGITELANATRVTATAVRQRLNRMMGQGFVAREIARSGRGRPSHRYLLTDKGRRRTGSNFVDLAIALWNEIRAVKDPEVRRGLLQRIAKSMAGMYSGRMHGSSPAERMQSVSEVFADRDVPFRVEQSEKDKLPVLTALACPYPQLAEQDRGICALERMMFAELVGTDLRLAECRLDGDSCCRFETN